MKKLSPIGLEIDKSKEIAFHLNRLLAHYQVYYMNTRGFHWNIKGNKFFELHAKFEELYTIALTNIDEVAERILTLGEVPMHSYSQYLEVSEIPERNNISDGDEAVSLIVQGTKTLLKIERKLLELASETGDEGTSALMSDYIREQEKTVWMYSSFLGKSDRN
ncbi:DNA starvation/stationary phase protection protein [Muricauda oceani]|uniref:DNA starvation/stationary phase protection protein n=1 Tax=Flagellimonas oceani TaxID=2698672 RepID=A0A6G7IZ48_9FLAO|nr:Dps family protein [Allomuricauda oceani]MBW8244805.1 DNA starvation/stationary phase protection protein [Allomuricauda oceani]QII43883.1 DNA starvation/stationary phase protection protein [Allomuricauda oceani]